jgi:hypothetical protein
MEQLKSVKALAAKRASVLKDGLKQKVGMVKSSPSLLESLRIQHAAAVEQGEKEVAQELEEQIDAILAPPTIGKTYRIRLCSSHSSGAYLDAHRSMPRDRHTDLATFVNSHLDNDDTSHEERSSNDRHGGRISSSSNNRRELLSGQWLLEPVVVPTHFTSSSSTTSSSTLSSSDETASNNCFFRLRLQTGHHGCPRGLYLCGVPKTMASSGHSKKKKKKDGEEAKHALHRTAQSTWCFVQPLWCCDDAVVGDGATVARGVGGEGGSGGGGGGGGNSVLSVWSIEPATVSTNDGKWRLRLVTENVKPPVARKGGAGAKSGEDDDNDGEGSKGDSDATVEGAEDLEEGCGGGDDDKSASPTPSTARSVTSPEDITTTENSQKSYAAPTLTLLSRRAKADAVRAQTIKAALSGRGGGHGGDLESWSKRRHYYLEVCLCRVFFFFARVAPTLYFPPHTLLVNSLSLSCVMT